MGIVGVDLQVVGVDTLERGYRTRDGHRMPVLKNPARIEDQRKLGRVGIERFFLMIQPDRGPPIRFSVEIEPAGALRHGILFRDVPPLRTGMCLRWAGPEESALLLQPLV